MEFKWKDIDCVFKKSKFCNTCISFCDFLCFSHYLKLIIIILISRVLCEPYGYIVINFSDLHLLSCIMELI